MIATLTVGEFRHACPSFTHFSGCHPGSSLMYFSFSFPLVVIMSDRSRLKRDVDEAQELQIKAGIKVCQSTLCAA